MQRNVWIAVAVIALAAAAFFGVRYFQLSGNTEAEERNAAMQRELDAMRASEQEAVRKIAQETEARRLAEMKAKEEAENEARRLAQAESERVAQEQARKRAEDEARKAAAELEQIRGERARLSSEAQRLAELRARESADARAKLAAAQRALEESERKKNAEIERQAAVIASYSRSPNPTEPPTEEEKKATQRVGNRIIFPADYKRANHYYLPLLPAHERGNAGSE